MDQLIKRDCCPICASKNIKIINKVNILDDKKLENFFLNSYNYQLVEYLKSQAYVFKVLHCNHCFTYFQESFLPESLMHLFYNSSRTQLDSINNALKYVLDSNSELTDIRNFKKKTLREILNLINKKNQIKKSILDAIEFGSGWGFFALALEHNNINVRSVEISSIRRSFQKDVLGLDCYKSIDEIKGIKTDIISCIQVIEHLNYPMKVINSLYEKLNIGGILRIEVPLTLGLEKRLKNNFHSIIGKSSLQPLEHLQAFSNKTFEQISSNLKAKHSYMPLKSRILNRIKRGNLESTFNRFESTGIISFIKMENQSSS